MKGTTMGRFVAAAAPKDWKDAFVRVLKTFVSGGLSGATMASFTSVSALQGVVFAGGTAVFSFAQNAILKWANN